MINNYRARYELDRAGIEDDGLRDVSEQFGGVLFMDFQVRAASLEQAVLAGRKILWDVLGRSLADKAELKKITEE